MESQSCPACKAKNDEDAAYCDQCGQPLTETSAADAEGGCPACGGAVESREDGKGVCARCGLELVETPDELPAKADEGTVARLTAAILRRTGAGLPLEQSVAEGCVEIFQAPAPDKAPPAQPGESDEPEPCPLCGVESPLSAAQCGGCGLWFREPRTTPPCPRCGRAVRGGKCECGAILTLPRLLKYVEASMRFVCARCKQPYATSLPKCPDCGGGFISAERLKAYAKDEVS